MKLYFHTDIEGVAGWAFYHNRDFSRTAPWEHTQRMNALFTGEIVAACQAALDAGAETIYINDAHGPAYNVLFEQLPAGCRIIHGRAGYFEAWLSQLDASFDAMLCLGQHAMAGTPRSVCPHSLWHINGELHLSETTMAAALAGSLGVPTLLVSGDDKICAECREKIPDIHAVEVKKGIAAQNACSLAPVEARQRIAEGVRNALADLKNIEPYVVPGPYRINLSDRDPKKLMFDADVEGDELWETFHRAINQIPGYGHFGEDPIDDRSFRWP